MPKESDLGQVGLRRLTYPQISSRAARLMENGCPAADLAMAILFRPHAFGNVEFGNQTAVVAGRDASHFLL